MRICENMRDSLVEFFFRPSCPYCLDWQVYLHISAFAAKVIYIYRAFLLNLLVLAFDLFKYNLTSLFLSFSFILA